MGLRILVVDDEPLTVEAHRKLIRKWRSDVEVLEALSVPEMLEISRDWDPDIILLDVRIPGGDGLSALKTLRHEGFSNEAIITTAFTCLTMQSLLWMSGLPFLVKPIRPNHLIEAMERASSVIKSRRARGKTEKCPPGP